MKSVRVGAEGIAAMVVAVLLGVLLAGCGAPQGAKKTSAQAPTLAVMTFNVRYGTARDGENDWAHRRAFFFDTIRAADPDVIGFQEALAFQVKEACAELPGYQVVYACREDGKEKGESCAILFRGARLSLDESGTFWLSDTPEIVGSNTWKAACVRICTWVRLTEKQSHRSFYVFNTHLDHVREEARVKGIGLILERIDARGHKDEPVILTGDFNAGEETPAARLAAEHLSDTYRAVHPRGAAGDEPAGTFNNFKNQKDGEKIDYIFVTPGTPVEAAEIVRTTREGRNASDHFAVTARVRMP